MARKAGRWHRPDRRQFYWADTEGGLLVERVAAPLWQPQPPPGISEDSFFCESRPPYRCLALECGWVERQRLLPVRDTKPQRAAVEAALRALAAADRYARALTGALAVEAGVDASCLDGKPSLHP